VELPPVFSIEAPLPAANPIESRAALHGSATHAAAPRAGEVEQMLDRPVAIASPEASTGESQQIPEHRIPASSQAQPAEPVNQPSLTDVLSKYFGTPLSARVIGKIPPVPDVPQASSLEA
jgi:hypothetical protein